MKRYTFFYILCLAAFFSAAAVYAQDRFPGPGVTPPSPPSRPPAPPASPPAVMIEHPITVNEARNLPRDSWVILTGNIVNSLPGGRYYTFRDSSGEIIVEIGWRVWRGLSVGATDRVEICGEVNTNRRQVSINVEAITGIDGTNSGQGQAVTVNEARNLPRDSWVILTGNIVNTLPGQGGRNYTFRDSTGEITVEIDRKTWRGLSVGATDRVEISGGVRTNSRQTSINVKAIRKK